MQKQGSLGRRLVIALLATAVIGAVCWAGALYLTRSAAERLCEQYAERVQAVTTTVHRDLARLAAQPATIAVDAAGVGPAFVATVESNPLYITVGLSDADGNSIFSTYRQNRVHRYVTAGTFSSPCSVRVLQPVNLCWAR
ncbi:MAG: hypothetical protein FIA89_07875 [Geobacter sp.]|nr:hypothetical protein [Geobacter sp.]